MAEKITQDSIDEAALKFVQQARDHFLKQRQNAHYDEEWKQDERSYFNDTDDFYKGVAKLRIPVLHQAVERIVPKLDKSIFPPDGRWFDIKPDNRNDSLQVENAIKSLAFLKDQFSDIKVRIKLIGIYRSLATYGTVFIKTFWDHKIKERFKRNDKNEREKVWETVFDNPDVYSPSIWDIFVDIKDEDLEGLLIERIVKNFQELWENRERTEAGEKVGIYRNVNLLKDVKTPEQKTDTDERNSEKIRGLRDHNFGPHEHKVEIFEAWGPIPKWYLTKSSEDKENNLFIDGLIVTALNANGKGAVLRISDNPFDHQEKPYLRSRYIKVDGRLYGIGVMTVNIPLEAELNTLRTQIMDNRTFMLKNKWLKDSSADIDNAALKDLSEQIIETNNMLGLQALRPPDFTSSALASEAGIKQDIEDSTGASKLLGGGAATRTSLERTASGIATVVQGGLDRLELVATGFEEELLKPMARQFWQLDQQFLPEGRELSVLGSELIRIHPRDIPIPTINFIGIKELAAKDFKINALNTILQNLIPFTQFGLDPIPVLFLLFRLMGFGDIIEEIDKRPNSEEQLEDTPEGEIQLLRQGRRVKINFDDRHEDFIRAYNNLLAEENIPEKVRKNTNDALGQRLAALTLRDNPEILENIVKSRKKIATNGK